MSEVTAAIFHGGQMVEHVALDGSMPQHGDSAFIWIEAFNPSDDDFTTLQRRFKVHSLAVKDAMSPSKAPKIDVYDGQIFVVLKIARLAGDEIRYSGSQSTRPGPDCILHAIMDFVVNIPVEARGHSFQACVDQDVRCLRQADEPGGPVEASSLLAQQRQGASTRKLAGWAAVSGAPTAIAAFYGMNIPNVPALHAPGTYPIVIGVMLAICVGLYVRLRKLRWL